MEALFDRHRGLLDECARGAAAARILDAFPGGSERQVLWRDRPRGRARGLRIEARHRLRPPRPPRIASRRRRGLALGAGARHHLSRRGRRHARRRLRIGRRRLGRRLAGNPRRPPPRGPGAAQRHELRDRQRGDAHHRPGLRHGLPGRRPARPGPRAGGRRHRLGRDDARPRHARSGRSRRARPRPSSSRSTGASSRAASRSSSAARPSRPGTAIPASSPASPPATPSS